MSSKIPVPTWGSLCLCLLFAGCAGVSHREIYPEKDHLGTGFRYYDSSPYLLVQTNNEGGLKSELIYLPDLTKKRQAKPYTFLARNDTTFEFEKGVLTNSSLDSDATQVPKAVIGALEKVATEAIKAGAMNKLGGAQETPPQVDQRAPNVYLFKIVKRRLPDGKGGFESQCPEWGLIGAEGGSVYF